MIQNNLQVLEVLWLNNNNNSLSVGIVKALDKLTNETKFYIGTGTGYDEKQDIALILAFGTKITLDKLVQFFKAKPKEETLKGQGKMEFDDEK